MSGAVAVKGEGGAREGATWCCWDISELAPPMVTAPGPADDPSVPENTPAMKINITPLLNGEHGAQQCRTGG